MCDQQLSDQSVNTTDTANIPAAVGMFALAIAIGLAFVVIKRRRVK